jgi:ribosomal protein S18 acetylase RimI-like enzyme
VPEDRTTLTDADGRAVLVYSLSEDARDGRPWADGASRPDDVPVEDAVLATLAQLSGHAVSSSDRLLVAGLVAAGASELRHAHEMSHDLRELPERRTPDGLAVHRFSRAQLVRHAQRIGELRDAAYPPGHPDHSPRTRPPAEVSRSVANGEVLGPFMPVSQVAVHDHAIVGAAVIVDRPGKAPDGGPWVLDIFRDPTSPLRGVGRGLLTAVLHDAREDGLASISLAVSHDNANALGLYESLGFVDHEQSWTLALPGG